MKIGFATDIRAFNIIADGFNNATGDLDKYMFVEAALIQNDKQRQYLLRLKEDLKDGAIKETIDAAKSS